MKILGDECTVVVLPAMGKKCVRCWVYAAEKEEDICQRCENTLRSLPKEKFEKLFE
jgi:isoleucyl-tRNA synthetase